MRIGWRLVAYTLSILLAAYFIYVAVKTLDLAIVGDAISSPGVLASLVLAALLYSSIIPVSAWAWTLLLAAQGERWDSLRLARLMGMTQLAKYVPGNVAQHATRAALAIRGGMGARSYLSTVTQETVLAIFGSLLVGLSLLAISGKSITGMPAEIRTSLPFLVAAISAVVILLAVLKVEPGRTTEQSSFWRRTIARVGGLPGASVTFKALAAYCGNYLLIGFGLWTVAWAIGTGVSWPLVTAAFALSWVLGFLTPGAPAGFGAREGIMLLVLSGAAADSKLTLFVLLARAVTMAGDIVCFTVAFLSGHRENRGHSNVD